MRIEQVGRALPFSCEQVFDLAADIERYPQFLPWWQAATIQRREDNIRDVQQVMGIGAVRVPFASRAVLQRPERLDITSSDPYFREFSLTLQVVPVPPSGCQLSVSAHVQLRSIWLQKILQRVLAGSVNDIIAAFEARAHALYDPRAVRAGPAPA
jgi:coenzyme Q-binding protein COQ10